MIYDVKAYLSGLRDIYKEEAREGLDFWAEHGMDWEKGGLVTYLDREGNWYLDEKQGWFTGRAMFSFAKSYNDLYKEERWLKAAENLYEFMVKHQFYGEKNEKLYHNLSRDGEPCDSNPIGGRYFAKSTGLHDEAFAVMGLAELYKATGRQDVKETLYKVFDTEIFIYNNPQYYTDGILSKEGSQPKVELAWLMSLLCSTQTARGCDTERKEYYTSLIAGYIEQVKKYYYIKEQDLITEAQVDCPGHSMEVAWFMLAEGMYTKDKELINMCARAVDRLFYLGWDKQYGGFNLFANMEGKNAFNVQQGFKYWWPNNELENGLMYAYIGTGEMHYLEKYRMVHEWVFSHFPDREMGEWYGYLNHDGTPISKNKGDNQKGPFHLYRSFCSIHNVIDYYLTNKY